MGEGIELGKVEKALTSSSVFESDTRSAGCAYGGGTVSAVAGGSYCNQADLPTDYRNTSIT